MRITINDIKTSMGTNQTYDIVNAIRNSSSDSFQQYVPLANYDNIAQVGAGIMVTQAIQNEFVMGLVDRIGLFIVTQVSLKNPLAKFKKGAMTDGRTIEEVFTDIAKEHLYDPDTAESEVFKREIPDVKTLFHEVNRKGFYKQTIQDQSLRQAFTSWASFEKFLGNIINAMYNSAEVDEYEYMKLVADNYYSKGLFTVVPILDPVDSTSETEFIKTLKATASKMTLPQGSRDYNALAVRTRSEMDGLHLLIDAELNAKIDVDVLSKAFNMDKASFLGHITPIDGFASAGVKAILIDEGWYMVYDQDKSMESIRNPQGKYWNYYYHIWQVLSASRFSNAVAFVTNDQVKAVTNIIVDPPLASLKAGKTMEFTAYVRVTDGNTYPVTWSVSASTTATTLKGGTSIDSNGTLTIDATQTGELAIDATVHFLDNKAKTTLTASAAAGATALTVADSSLFAVGDMVMVGTETDAIQISAIGSATSITLASGLVSAQANGANVTKQDTVTGEAIVSVIPAS